MKDISSVSTQYRSTDFIVPGPGKLELIYTPNEGGKPTALNVYDFEGPGIALAMYNTDEVGYSTARVNYTS